MPTYPVQSLRATSFGAFADIDINFAPGLNVIVGDNGAGKTQLLKLLYGSTATLKGHRPESLTKSNLNRDIAGKLTGVFGVETVGRLTNRVRGRARAEASVKFRGIGEPLSFGFASNSRTEVVTTSVPLRELADTPVYLPTRELMSIYPGFVSLYNERVLEFDETWRDTADLLGRPPLRGPRSQLAREVLTPVEEVLGGSIREDGGSFYLQQPGVGNLEMHLVAEGLRKLAMVVRLVQSGTLLEGGYLFWDEPEANLNPATLRRVAIVIKRLADSGVQIFVATHSLFLLRELDLLHADKGQFRLIGLARDDAGVVSSESDRMEDLDLRFIAALQAEFDQSDRYVGNLP